MAIEALGFISGGDSFELTAEQYQRIQEAQALADAFGRATRAEIGVMSAEGDMRMAREQFHVGDLDFDQAARQFVRAEQRYMQSLRKQFDASAEVRRLLK